MSAAVLRPLGDVRRRDAPEVGGKAALLGEVIAAGARVPDGVVVTAAAGDLPAAERRALLRKSVVTLGDGPFAVRSSGVGEDGVERSFAGMYETLLGVEADAVPAAAEQVLLSVRARRVEAYGSAADGGMAVIVQRMVTPAAAGVALTADPIGGDRRVCIVTAVRGLGDRLVSGRSVGDEWVVGEAGAVARRTPERAIGAAQAARVASEARRIASVMGSPQDVEWALDADGQLWILQARPMTALPPAVSWEPPAPGAYTRQLRFGEWISEPVTPLFESWLLTAMEQRTHADYLRLIGQRVPRPYHVIVNGWYFYTTNWATPGAFARNLPNMLWHLVRFPRRLAGINPGTVRHSVPIMEREWRADVRPRYRAAVSSAEQRVDTMPVTSLPALVDELADAAGEAFTWVTALAGAGYKLELNLARFYRRHLAPALGGSHLPLLIGFEPPADPPAHAVISLDWWHEPGPPVGSATVTSERHADLVATRLAAEQAAVDVLASNPRRLRAFGQLLADSQHLVPLREEQVAELTIAWPVMRRAVLRIGEALASDGVIAQRDDVFFLTRDEVLSALRGEAGLSIDVAARRSSREEQARLAPPLVVGHLNPMLTKLVDGMRATLGGSRSSTAIVSGTPASPGRATGVVRVIHGPQQFGELEPGEILVAPLTA
ncbi:MAG: hypothetical protein M3Y29_04230, partial [Chloroflexota bacterium]|nr:hypothetical protein [Chloroflexota bacterium]